ncbi:hypothetical protein F5X96DRAFT_621822 [Biscogniauxia mediterranea]|nr:hypothetical protein F5X96DRAFT_621822 [Biscogniauxia mediterranea]
MYVQRKTWVALFIYLFFFPPPLNLTFPFHHGPRSKPYHTIPYHTLPTCPPSRTYVRFSISSHYSHPCLCIFPIFFFLQIQSSGLLLCFSCLFSRKNKKKRCPYRNKKKRYNKKHGVNKS